MVDEETIRRKHDLLAAEMHHYFWDTCPELAARWKGAMGLPPPVLRELAGRLQDLEDFTNQTNRELKAVHDTAAEDRGSVEQLLDRALASLEHLGEIAESMTRVLDGLLK
jgi:hypothetical protein